MFVHNLKQKASVAKQLLKELAHFRSFVFYSRELRGLAIQITKSVKNFPETAIYLNSFEVTLYADFSNVLSFRKF